MTRLVLGSDGVWAEPVGRERWHNPLLSPLIATEKDLFSAGAFTFINALDASSNLTR